MYVLGIETSCDETAAAVVKDGREVLSNVINSQIKIHKEFGGVVPEIASRNHVEEIEFVVKEALEKARSFFGRHGCNCSNRRSRVSRRFTCAVFLLQKDWHLVQVSHLFQSIT